MFIFLICTHAWQKVGQRLALESEKEKESERMSE